MRGTSGMSKSRVLLWIFVAITAWLGINIGMQLILIYGMANATFGFTFMTILWSALVIYLLTTSKKHRGHQGAEHMIFYAGGFGPCSILKDSNTPCNAQITPWCEVNAFTMDKKGSNFQRIRIGRKWQNKKVAKLKTVMVDAGLKCTPQQAQFLAKQISDHIQAESEYETPTTDY